MKCPPGTCFTCRLAGLTGCPFSGAALPLAETVKVTKKVYPEPEIREWHVRLWKFMQEKP